MRTQAKIIAISAALTMTFAPARGQFIDFETLPDGSPTVDEQVISNEYLSAFGVAFELVDPVTGVHVGFPRIAKVGDPLTAFASCEGGDTPLPGQGIGGSFLTDNSSIGVADDLLISYASPVASASGVILDVDCRSPNGSLPCEEWVVEAIDTGGTVIDFVTITGPTGPSQGACVDANGFGNSRSFGWSFNHASADIAQIRLRYTGAAQSVGLGFDLFSPAAGAGPLTAEATAPTAICVGESLALTGAASGGTPPYSFAWERDDAGVWTAFSNVADTTAQFFDDATIRFRVTDSLGAEFIAGPFMLDTRLPRLIISQESAPGAGDFDANILGELSPFVAPGTLTDYYGWTSTSSPYQGPDPALVTDRSHMFIVRGTDGLGLFVVHDDATAGAGGRAEMRLEFTGMTPALVVQDDPNDTYVVDAVAGVVRTRQSWQDTLTDGFVIGPLGAEWQAFIQFKDEFSGSPTIDGLTSWFAYSDPVSGFSLALATERRVRIEAVCSTCIADLNLDGVVSGADLAALLAAWGSASTIADLNGDNAVDGADLAALLAAWGPCP